MGWASGSQVFSEIIDALKDVEGLSVEKRKDIYAILIDVFEDADCDTLDECLGEDPAFDDLWEELHGEDDDYE